MNLIFLAQIVCGIMAGAIAATAYGFLRGDPRLIGDEPEWMRKAEDELSQTGVGYRD